MASFIRRIMVLLLFLVKTNKKCLIFTIYSKFTKNGVPGIDRVIKLVYNHHVSENILIYIMSVKSIIHVHVAYTIKYTSIAPYFFHQIRMTDISIVILPGPSCG